MSSERVTLDPHHRAAVWLKTIVSNVFQALLVEIFGLDPEQGMMFYQTGIHLTTSLSHTA